MAFKGTGKIDVTGRKSGMLFCISDDDFGNRRKALFQCECGNQKLIMVQSFRTGRSSSCGCNRYINRSSITKHGLVHLPEYKIWSSMRQRCSNPNSQVYQYYGSRGIRVCETWNDFSRFYEDMGPRPSKNHSIDRIDVDGNYEPRNCRWATTSEQSLNRTDNHLIEYGGFTLPIKAMADKFGMLPNTLRSRLKYGWSVNRAIETPVNIAKRKKTERV